MYPCHTDGYGGAGLGTRDVSTLLEQSTLAYGSTAVLSNIECTPYEVKRSVLQLFHEAFVYTAESRYVHRVLVDSLRPCRSHTPNYKSL